MNFLHTYNRLKSRKQVLKANLHSMFVWHDVTSLCVEKNFKIFIYFYIIIIIKYKKNLLRYLKVVSLTWNKNAQLLIKINLLINFS